MILFNLNLDYSIFIITAIFFIIGFLLSYLLKSKNITYTTNQLPKIDNMEIIEAIENRKQIQIDSIMHRINDIQVKLDLIESILTKFAKMSYTDSDITNFSTNITETPRVTSQDIMSGDVIRETSPTISHQHIKSNNPIVLTDKQNATNYYILKILLKESLTSNEIKNAIGRTREHTARLMKKLYDLKLVDREITIKPFKYRLTEQGEKYIKDHIEKNDSDSSSSPPHNTLFDLTQ